MMDADGVPVNTTSSFSEPIPLYFGPAERRLFGWYHPAAECGGAHATIAIVLCRPIGYEALCTFASYRYLAERLAAAGYPVLRFDYDGTGDSCGRDEDPDRVPRWIASIRHAVDTIRSVSGVREVSLFGLRLGATLAALAAAQLEDIHSLMLWAACRTGRSFLREMRMLYGTHQQQRAPQGGEGDEAPAVPMEKDYEEAGGFIFTTQTVAALGEVDFTKLASRPAPRALLIGRDDMPEDKKIGERLEALGTGVERVTWPGYAGMMRDPLETVIPGDLIDSVAGWLDAQAGAFPVLPKRPNGGIEPKVAIAEEVPVLDTPQFHEEPLFRGGAPNRFGILTLPAAGTPAAGWYKSRPVILLLSSGANPHIGPNRLNVTLARRLAGAGFAVFRVDAPGLGDSARGGVSTGATFFAAPAISDVQTMIGHLQSHLGIDRFVLFGLCSGAFVAYSITPQEPRIVAQILVNQPTYDWKEGDTIDIHRNQSYKPTRVYMTYFRKKDSLRRILKRQVDIKGISRILIKRLGERSEVALQSTRAVLASALHAKRFETAVQRNLRTVADRGGRTLLLFAEYDYALEVTETQLSAMAQRSLKRRGLSVEIVPNADHTFSERVEREKMFVAVENYLTKTFPAAAASRSGG